MPALASIDVVWLVDRQAGLYWLGVGFVVGVIDVLADASAGAGTVSVGKG
jgi:hypothetical protein